MRKILTVLLAFSLLIPGAQAAEGKGKYAALTVEGCPNGALPRLLAEMEHYDAKVTFLLSGVQMEADPELTRAIADSGHEIGLSGFSCATVTGLSRRKIGRELADARALLPKNCKVTFVRPPDGVFTDGLRQVAEVTNLSLLGWSSDPGSWHGEARQRIGRIRDGDVIRIRAATPESIDAALSLIDQLQKQGYSFVTVSQLAKTRKVRLHPGKIYASFYPAAQA